MWGVFFSKTRIKRTGGACMHRNTEEEKKHSKRKRKRIHAEMS